MNQKPKRINDRGVAMIVTMLVVLALSMLATGVVLITTSEVFVTRNEAYGKEAFYAAEAGLRHAERVLYGHQLPRPHQRDVPDDGRRFPLRPAGQRHLEAASWTPRTATPGSRR